MTHTDDISISLTLNIAGTSFSITGGAIKGLTLSLHSYGYTGSIDFLISNYPTAETLLTSLCKGGLINVSLTVSAYVLSASQQTIAPITLTGLATVSGFSEQLSTNVEIQGDPVVSRHYFLEFADPAQVLWKQHYPCDLLVNSTLQALLTAQAGSSITLQYNWSLLTQQYAMIALPLGAAGNQASFYDFVIWLVDTNNGVFTYDYTNNSYSLSSQKNAVSNAASPFNPDIAACHIDIPQTPLYQPRVMNGVSTQQAQISVVSNAQNVSPLYHDYIGIYSVASDFTAAVNLQTARFNLPQYQVSLTYAEFPAQPSLPGQFIQFEGNYWNSALYVYGNTYRVRDWFVRAKAVEPEAAVIIDQPNGRYQLDFSMKLECSNELCVELPAYTPPAYPFFVQGIVYSSQGTTTQTTYQFTTNQTTSQNYYQINIPLWSNIQIQAPFIPNFQTGQFYFPLTNNSVVLVGLNFTDAFIAGMVNWESTVNVPMSSQGNQLVMGQSSTSQTVLTHSYVNSSPQLQLQRTQGGDTELLQFSTGSILLTTQTTSSS